MPNISRINGRLSVRGEDTLTGNVLSLQNQSGLTVFNAGNSGRITLTNDQTVTLVSTAVIAATGTNVSIALVPGANGGLMLNVPDNSPSGGNLRGQNAIDLQMVRSSPTHVASGTNSVVIGGANNGATNTHAVAIGGQGNTASAQFSVAVGGFNNIATGPYSSIVGGSNGYTWLHGQRTTGYCTAFADIPGNYQSSVLTWWKNVSGTSAQLLYLDGTSAQATLPIGLPYGANARAWRIRIEIVAIVEAAGTGGSTLVQNDVWYATYYETIKRTAAGMATVGTLSLVAQANDSSLVGSAIGFIISPPATFGIQFSPPPGARNNSAIRVVATGYITEISY